MGDHTVFQRHFNRRSSQQTLFSAFTRTPPTANIIRLDHSPCGGRDRSRTVFATGLTLTLTETSTCCAPSLTWWENTSFLDRLSAIRFNTHILARSAHAPLMSGGNYPRRCEFLSITLRAAKCGISVTLATANLAAVVSESISFPF